MYQAAKRSKTKNVIVATPDKEIFRLVKSVGGDAIITQNNHKTGTDRIFEVYKNKLKKPKIIINLQGDMPNIKASVIKKLINYMKKSKCDIGTLASKLNVRNEQKTQM